MKSSLAVERISAELVRRSGHYRLLADPTRLAIVDALSEGPRQIGELARLVGVHRNTVRAHLRRLEEAGLVTAEAGTPRGRGRPALRFRLRSSFREVNPEQRLLVDGLVRALRRAAGPAASELAEAEGYGMGRQLATRLRHPSIEQAVEQVTEVLDRLGFRPVVERRGDTFALRLGACPFGVLRDDRRGEVVCPFHRGLIRGIAAEAASGEVEQVDLLPFAARGVCVAEIRAATRR